MIKYAKTSKKKEQYRKMGERSKTIVNIGWPKVDTIIVPLFMWLLDSNWPGSSIINHFLLTLRSDVLYDKIKQIVDNSPNYDPADYNDLLDIISEFCKEKGMDAQ